MMTINRNMFLNYIIAFSTVILTSALGSLFTSKNTKSDWYSCIKPSLTPPSYVFPIVWTILYFLLGLAFAFSLKSKLHIINALFVATFILNVLWSYFYFGRKQVEVAYYIILTLDLIGLLIIALSIFINSYKIAIIVLPYFLWILFASILNYKSIDKAKKC